MQLPAPNVTIDELRRALQLLDILLPYALLYGREKVKEVEYGLLTYRSLIRLLLDNKEWLQTRVVNIP